GSPLRAGAYLRIDFDVVDPSVYQQLQLHMKYDDGYVAYLNGVKVHERFAPAAPAWDSLATENQEAEVDAYEVFDVTHGLGELVAGSNVFAIHGMNRTLTSSDFLVMPELIAGAPDPGGSIEPQIEIGTIEFNPASGNQDEEYIELVNNNAIWVDVSDWTITGGVEFALPPGTVIPPGSSIYLSPNVKTFRGRATSPKGGERNLVVGGYSGHLSSFGESLELRDASGALNSSTSYVGDPSDPQQSLVVTEIMYHPEPDGDAEYIELMNISDSVTLDLTGVTFTQGITFDFTDAAITSLAPGQRLVLVKNTVAFEAAHSAGLPVAGIFALSSSLSNGGESIKLEDAEGGTIKEFTYDDKTPWPTSPDTGGFSLVLISPETNPDPDLPESWRASFAIGGTPGSDDSNSFTGDPGADTDGDGLSALIEYAAGTSDSGTDSGITSTGVVEIGGMSYPTFTYQSDPSATDVVVNIETSTDLSGWSDATGDFVETGTVMNLDGTATKTYRFSTVISEEGKRFFRLKVALN
ncbi:MAG: lamin tail domain-containing protein, partial [Verrucomicrobiales bacterium]